MDDTKQETEPLQGGITGGSPAQQGHDQWILKGLNDLRDDFRELTVSVNKIGTDVSDLEKLVKKYLHIGVGIVLVVGILWSGAQLLTSKYDISLTPKDDMNTESN